MSDNAEKDGKKTLSLGGGSAGGNLANNAPRPKLELKKPVDAIPGAQQVRQSFSHGRSKAVAVEEKRSRDVAPRAASSEMTRTVAPAPVTAPLSSRGASPNNPKNMRALTNEERELRLRVLEQARIAESLKPKKPEPVAEEPISEDLPPPPSAPASSGETTVVRAADAPPPPVKKLSPRERELLEMQQIAEEEKRRAEAAAMIRAEEIKRKQDEEARKKAAAERKPAANSVADQISPRLGAALGKAALSSDDDDGRKKRGGGAGARKTTGGAGAKRGGDGKRGGGDTGRFDMSAALSGEDSNGRTRSMAAVRRAREKERLRLLALQDQPKIARDIIIPETIAVQELANRMAERAGDVIKVLMKMGMMVTINAVIDADTAELVAGEFGHRFRRVADSDVELGLTGGDDAGKLLPRAPVVTIMGHVDHGKTSLLDKIRKSKVASGEAGGITQHIGAYQVSIGDDKITFIDTPGHAAFSEMRSRGANVTDVVVLVVAADDSVMPQTIEAISHAKAARVPIVVAINKIDLPGANPQKVREQLLQYEIISEDLGGDTMMVEVSAKAGLNIDKLLQTILLQAEVLDLKANPDRPASGRVVEAKLDKGRGAVATVLVQNGTLKTGDIFVSGSEWGRVRALVNDSGKTVTSASPSVPVEVLGLSGAPRAGDDFIVVENENRAREIAEYRFRQKKDLASAAASRGSLQQMFDKISAGEKKELAVVIKSDVQGSTEALISSLGKIAGDSTEVGVRVLHSGVGAISESDITLARASGGFVIGFNVRANAPARDLAKRDGVDIRYYSIIYNVIDDVKIMLNGLLAPTLREQFLGNAQIREVFNITKSGKVAGCMITEGMVKRGAKVRLLRDDVVIHEGTLKTLKRFKDEVKEVKEGYECGMAFEHYEDIRVGDIIEAFEIVEEQRTL